MSKKHENRFSINIKKDKPHVIEFCSLQSNLNDTISYLIEKEIAENGIRNLQLYIPSSRYNDFFLQSNIKNEVAPIIHRPVINKLSTVVPSVNPDKKINESPVVPKKIETDNKIKLKTNKDMFPKPEETSENKDDIPSEYLDD
ncbi:MAG: hypothetical protein AB7V16_11405 [Vulcanibacillus sp.]